MRKQIEIKRLDIQYIRYSSMIYDVICGTIQIGHIIQTHDGDELYYWQYYHHDKPTISNNDFDTLVIIVNEFLVNEINLMLIDHKEFIIHDIRNNHGSNY